ncbi:hypothetical protein HZH66_006686 [Vespula vulgaris]|uniref:Uncharacterized protein n=1 Tax=Vespula vulgaris TaxID=7454 RepID=A0A834K5L9_VESVU|nr:hypothetical protein HZH66_006686 [Vespula vulgaris]
MKKRNAADPGSAGRVLPRDQREKEDQRTSEPIERGMLASQHASRITNVSNILYTSANTYTGEMDAKYCHCRRELEPERSRWRLYEDYDDGRLANDEGRRRERFAEASRAAARHGGSAAAAAAAAAAAVAAAVTIATVAVAAAVAATEWKTTTLAEKGMEGKSSDGGSSKLVAPRKYLRDRATAESASNAKEMRSDGCC